MCECVGVCECVYECVQGARSPLLRGCLENAEAHSFNSQRQEMTEFEQ